MQWAALSSPPAPAAPATVWMGRRARTARLPSPGPRRVVLAAAASSSPSPDANSNSPGSGGGGGGGEEVEEEREDAARMEKAAAFLMRSQKYAMLKQQLAVAAQFEDYKEAARLRDSLKSFEEEEPVLRLRRSLKKAVEEERFEDAAKYRDELKILAPHALLKCSSDATTLGIRVQVRSVYIESRSQPLKGQFFFAYRIRITNNSQRPVQLLRRHWIVTDANGRTENIWQVSIVLSPYQKNRVVGEQPVIFPRTGFEYSSACPLNTPNGRMEGDFEMKHIDKAGSSTFNVAIAPFSLSILGDDNDDVLL
uniref:ApaG domain-containing protein n=1 Tax=Oryza meridionalis TaxID=40149 RepID=A0A0E0DMP5_9ORYZ